MQKTEGIELSAFVRNPQKFSDMDMTGVNIIQGDALNEEDVLRAMEGQDILFCSLEGDVLTMAKNIVAALDKTTVKRIIFKAKTGVYRGRRCYCGKQGSYYITALSRNTER